MSSTTQDPTKRESARVESRPVSSRRRLDKIFVIFCVCVASVSVVILAVLMIAIVVQGVPYLSYRFLTGINESEAANAGIYPALMGTMWVCLVCAAFTLPIGVGTAIFLEEFKPRHPVMRFFHNIVQLNINNLAGVPSVVYGIIGLTAFVAMFGLSRRVEVPSGEENSAAAEGVQNKQTQEVPLFEFGATYVDQFGVADSDRGKSIMFPVDGKLAPPLNVEDGMTGLTAGGKSAVNLIGPWEPVPKDSAVANSSIRTGSKPKRIEEDGKYFDEFESFAGTTLRAEVASKDAKPTQVKPGLKAIKADGKVARVRVLSSSQIPTVEFPVPDKGDAPLFTRVEIDGKHYDELKTRDDYVIRVPVESKDAPRTVPKKGRKVVGVTEFDLPANILFTDTPRPGGDKARFEEILRSAPEGGRIRRDAWYYFRLPFGRSVLAGGLTLMLVILPIIIIASQESLRAVPDSLREGALGMGATPWQVVRNVTLPAAVPGIMTGSILAMSRAIGEAAPVLIICGIVFISYTPGNLMSDFTVMPLQIYNWAALPDAEFQKVAASGIIVLLAVLLSFNALAVFIRQKMQKPLS